MNRTLSTVGSKVGTTIGLVAACALLLTACASGSLSSSDPTSTARSGGPATGSAAPASSGPSNPGPTLVVTVPELGARTEATEATVAGAPGTVAPATDPPATDAAEPPGDPTAAPSAPEEAAPPAEATTAVAPAAPAASPPGAGVNVSLANCDGCSVVATRSDVAGGRSAALVSTGSGRGLLLSVGPDGQVAGVIGVPYGAAFPAPADGLLPCAQGRCVVTGRQTDGRAILSAFELTDTGAWRDMSGDDAFPSATERSAVVDLDGELAIAVQDQGDGAAVWMLYTWGGDRYAVLGCAPDGDPPTSAGEVAAAACLS